MVRRSAKLIVSNHEATQCWQLRFITFCRHVRNESASNDREC
jgi:hypothetical protein